jgi:hypothetical protein
MPGSDFASAAISTPLIFSHLIKIRVYVPKAQKIFWHPGCVVSKHQHEKGRTTEMSNAFWQDTADTESSNIDATICEPTNSRFEVGNSLAPTSCQSVMLVLTERDI